MRNKINKIKFNVCNSDNRTSNTMTIKNKYLFLSGIVHTRMEVCRMDLEMSGLVE